MELDLGTCLTAVYGVVEDLYRAEFAPSKPVRRGHQPELSGGEVLTLAALAQWQRGRSERKFVAYAAAHGRASFPRLRSQSAFNRRARGLWGVLCALGPRVAGRVAAVAGAPAYGALDGVAVPLMRRCRGDRHRLFAAAASVGRGGSGKDRSDGVVLIPASTEERRGAAALLRWRAAPAAPAPTAAALAPVPGPAHRRRGQRTGPTGPIAPRLGAGAPAAGPYPADRGLRGAAGGQHRRDHDGAAVLTPARAAPADPAAGRATAPRARGLRQGVESAFQVLTAVLDLTFPRARTPAGLLARIGAKVATYDLALLLNHLFYRSTFSLFDPLG